jgi:AhpD family alkylhydroperoxidase
MSSPKLSAYAILSLARALNHPLSLLGRAIGGRLREQIVLRVSSINRCAICSAVHGTVAKIEGLSGEDIRRARSREHFEAEDERTQAALRYAEVRTANLEAEFPEVVETFERLMTPEEQREVQAIVDLFTFNNRFNNTWEGVLPGAKGRRTGLG